MCFESSAIGAISHKGLNKADEDGRVTKYPMILPLRFLLSGI